MFTRTESGLSSQHLFYNSDIVVYCEGKKGCGEASSFDEVFWQRVFAQNGKSVTCKSLGNKRYLRILAKKIAKRNVANVVVAMDRDYDSLLGTMINHRHVIYTYGYCWESDVIQDYNFNIALSLFATTNNQTNIYNDYNEFKTKQSNKLKRTFALDYKYISYTEKLFDRKKPQSIITIPRAAEPYVNNSRLIKKARTFCIFQSGRLPASAYANACGVRDFYGKTVAYLIYHWFVFRTRQINNGARKVNFDTFINCLIETLDMRNSSVARNRYYASKIALI